MPILTILKLSSQGGFEQSSIINQKQYLNSTGNKLKVLLVYTTKLSSFVQRDIKILEKRFNVTARLSSSPRDMGKIIRDISKSNVSVLWFATRTSAIVALVSKIFRKPTILILGGGDVASLPEYNYGLLARPFYRIFPILAIRLATVVLAVDEGLVEDVRRNTNIKKKEIGVLPTGYDSEKYKPQGDKKQMVLTVCSGRTWDRLRIKGVDIFIETSNQLPEIPFVIVGLHGGIVEEVKAMAKGNLTIIGELEEKELIRHYQMAKVYCQLSIREGLPNALCEAMLCECVPVGSDVQGVRTAIEDAGLLVPYGDVGETTAAVGQALESDLGPTCRKRVIDNFHVAKREQELIKAVDNLATTHETRG